MPIRARGSPTAYRCPQSGTRPAPISDPLIYLIFNPRDQKNRFFQKPHFLHFWASGPLGNCRGRDLELNGLIGMEIREILIVFEKFRFGFFLFRSLSSTFRFKIDTFRRQIKKFRYHIHDFRSKLVQVSSKVAPGRLQVGPSTAQGDFARAR